MRKSCRRLFSASLALAAILCVLASPDRVNAKTSSTTTTTSTTANSATTPSSSAPAPTATTTAVPTTTTTTTTPAAPVASSGPVRAKLIDVDDMSTSGLSKGTIDLYMSLTNKGKFDDALVGAETPVSDKLVLITITNKKEVEAPLHVDLPTGKAVKLAEGDKFLRISGIEKSLKDGDHIQLMLHFRSAPNVTVDVTVHKKSSFLGL